MFVSFGVLGVERRCRVKRSLIVTVFALVLLLGVSGCNEPAKPPPTQIIDAPKLAAAIKWIGGCGVICSFFGAAGMIFASRRIFKDK